LDFLISWRRRRMRRRKRRRREEGVSAEEGQACLPAVYHHILEVLREN